MNNEMQINETANGLQKRDALAQIGRVLDNNIEIRRDISEFNFNYDDRVNVFGEVSYMVVLVSKDFLQIRRKNLKR